MNDFFNLFCILIAEIFSFVFLLQQNKMDKHLYSLFRSLLFGNRNFQLKPYNNIVINKLVLDIQKIINVEETIRLGGLFRNQTIILQDLEYIIRYIERGNNHFLDKCSLKNKFPLELKSSIVRNFFYNLSRVCRGDLDNGILSNNYKKDIIPISNKLDEETLQHILKNENDYYLSFQNAEFWGMISKRLLQNEKPYNLSSIKLPRTYLKDIQHLYDIKCYSLGKIVNPYSLVLIHYNNFVDPIHWESVKALQLFIEHFPENVFSQTCRDFINLIITAIMTANNELLPKNILKDEIQLRKFIKNIDRIHNRIQKVNSNNTPLKLIDVFHRLLALLKYDYMWDVLNLDENTLPNETNILINMYLKNIELERENKMLREELITIEKKFHANS